MKKTKLKLEDFIEAFQMISNEDTYIDLNTGEIYDSSILKMKNLMMMNNQKDREILLVSLKGKGALRKFKDSINRLNLSNEWYKYRDECLKLKVIKWLEKNEIEYSK